jgi:V/A-type H+-transporting ATPase subunit D
MLAQLAALRAEGEVLERQRELVREELHTTGQRVNLFEKVKIPECKENIRVIRIFIGDEQTAAVVRGKIAKGRTPKKEEVDA